MIIFVHGEDTFRVKEKATELKTRFFEKFDQSKLNFEAFEGGVEPAKVVQAASAPPFLGTRRMVLVREVISRAKAAEADVWEGLVKRIPQDAIVVFLDGLAAAEIAKKPLMKRLKDLGETHVYDFPLLEGAALEAWVVARAHQVGLKIAKSEVQVLVSRVGGDLWQMQNELDKLVARAGGAAVTHEMIEELVRASFDDRMFAFVDALSTRDATKTLRILEEERLSGAGDFQIFAMVTRQVRILLGVRALLDEGVTSKDVIAKQLFLHPFVAQKAIGFCKRFTLAQLSSALSRCFDLDVAMKTGGASAEIGLEQAVATMLM